MLARVSSRIVRSQSINSSVRVAKQSLRVVFCSSRTISTSSRGAVTGLTHAKQFHSSATMSQSDVRSPLLDRATPENSLFFLCDIQENFREKMYQWPLLVASSIFMTRVAASLKIPIVVTEQKPFKPTIAEMTLSEHDHVVYSKSLFSMMTPDVIAELKSKHSDRKHVFLYGIEAHVCVMQTTLDLLRQGFIVHLPIDAISSMNKGDKDAAVARYQSMASLGVILTSAESAAFEIVSDSASATFKPLVPLIKEYSKAKAAAAQIQH